jgi:hypothetical protein
VPSDIPQPVGKEPLSPPQYERMANDLQMMSDMIRARPEMDHNFANRLEVLATEMREDEARVYPALFTKA